MFFPTLHPAEYSSCRKCISSLFFLNSSPEAQPTESETARDPEDDAADTGGGQRCARRPPCPRARSSTAAPNCEQRKTMAVSSKWCPPAPNQQASTRAVPYSSDSHARRCCTVARASKTRKYRDVDKGPNAEQEDSRTFRLSRNPLKGLSRHNIRARHRPVKAFHPVGGDEGLHQRLLWPRRLRRRRPRRSFIRQGGSQGRGSRRRPLRQENPWPASPQQPHHRSHRSQPASRAQDSSGLQTIALSCAEHQPAAAGIGSECPGIRHAPARRADAASQRRLQAALAQRCCHSPDRPRDGHQNTGPRHRSGHHRHWHYQCASVLISGDSPGQMRMAWIHTSLPGAAYSAERS